MDCLNSDNRTEMQKAKDATENPYSGAHYLEEALTETLSTYSDIEKASLVDDIYESKKGGKGHELKQFLNDVANYMQDSIYNDHMGY